MNNINIRFKKNIYIIINNIYIGFYYFFIFFIFISTLFILFFIIFIGLLINSIFMFYTFGFKILGISCVFCTIFP